MSAKHVHPVHFSDMIQSTGASFIDLSAKDPEQSKIFGAGVPGGLSEITYDFDEFFKRLMQMDALRRSLKIPPRSYHAWFTERYFTDGDVGLVYQLLGEFRHKYEMRIWGNYESAKILICIADEELGEDAGWEFYEWVVKRGTSARETFVGFGCPAWWEFVWYGLPIFPDWTMEILKNNHIRLTSPDESQIVGIGS